jgi:MAX-like protein X
MQVSKAVVLQKSIDYLQYLSQQKKKQEADLATLRKVKKRFVRS